MNNDDVKNNEYFNQTSKHPGNAHAFRRKAKMLLILPLLMLPFVTLAFWALGGGKGGSAGTPASNEKHGLNLDLPAANIKNDADEDKLAYYEKAKQQEEKNQEAMKNDPYFKLPDSPADSNELDQIVANGPLAYDPVPKNSYLGLNTSPVHSGNYKDPTEEKIRTRLSQLQEQINKPQVSTDYNEELPEGYNGNPGLGNDVDRLEEMMKLIQEKKGNDPEMQKLEGMLDKIIDIQHPDRVKERLREKSLEQKQQVFPVMRAAETANSSLLINDTNGKNPVPHNAFYTVNEMKENEGFQNAVEAVIHETQILTNGSNVKLRLLNDVYINGVLIPKDNFLYGVAVLEGERLKIEITSIRYNTSIFPVKLNVFDLDGIVGINIPGAITRDVAKQSADNSLQNVDIATLNPSITAQATAAGINTAKSLLSRKVKLVKVTVKAGYKVLLWNGDNGQ